MLIFADHLRHFLVLLNLQLAEVGIIQDLVLYQDVVAVLYLLGHQHNKCSKKAVNYLLHGVGLLEIQAELIIK